MPNVKPILFSGPMVRALLDGRKTQTRRVLKPQPPDGHRFVGIYGPGLTAVFEPLSRGDDYTVRLPYMPGDLLWVREAIYLSDDGHEEYAVFAADQKSVEEHLARIDALPAYFPEELRAEHKRLRPSIHMPRWASRITLEVTRVNVERLQSITREDARAEGVVEPEWDEWRENLSVALPEGSRIQDERDLFRDLWDSLYAKRGFGWDQNPWVIALTFVVHQMNIDEFLAQREAA